MSCTVEEYLNVMRSWLGYSELNGKHRKIIDRYNNQKKLPRGYKVKYSDEWCDTTITAAADKAGAIDIIGAECSCQRHIDIFKKMGIWCEDGTITPKRGYIIMYSWKANKQPNNATATHVGVVENVTGKHITVIEGNRNRSVARRVIPIGWGYIRGYGMPRYTANKKKRITDKLINDVINGKYGNEPDRKKILTDAGYDYDSIKKKVNERIREK